MIPYRQRFHGHNSLRYVSKHGVAHRSQYLTLKVFHNPKRPDNRIAVVVSKKVTKSAVNRNRIRRRLYEIVRLTSPLKKHYDIVIYVGGSTVKDIPHTDLKTSIHHLMQQAGIIESESPERDDIMVDKKVGL